MTYKPIAKQSEKTCLGCGNPAGYDGNRARKYCGYLCKKEYFKRIQRKGGKTTNCSQCGSEFYAYIQTIKYCSADCKYQAFLSKRSKKPNVKNCKFCGSEFKPYNSLDKYCSAKCRVDNEKSKRSFNWTEEQVKKRIGDNNPAFRNGMYTRVAKKSQVGNSLFFRNRDELHQEIIARDGYLHCEYCNSTDTYQFETHHIIYRSEKPGHVHLHDKANLIVLCMRCHNDFHKHKGKRDGIVIERKLNLLFGDDVLDKTEFLQRSI